MGDTYEIGPNRTRPPRTQRSTAATSAPQSGALLSHTSHGTAQARRQEPISAKTKPPKPPRPILSIQLERRSVATVHVDARGSTPRNANVAVRTTTSRGPTTSQPQSSRLLSAPATKFNSLRPSSARPKQSTTPTAIPSVALPSSTVGSDASAPALRRDASEETSAVVDAPAVETALSAAEEAPRSQHKQLYSCHESVEAIEMAAEASASNISPPTTAANAYYAPFTLLPEACLQRIVDVLTPGRTLLLVLRSVDTRFRACVMRGLDARMHALSDANFDAERLFREAMPALESAIQALNSLQMRYITEMRAFTNPPELVGKTVHAVHILLSDKPPARSWAAQKKLMADGREFMDRLLCFEKDKIDDGKIRLLKRTYLCDPTFTPEQVGLQSYAARSLCRWVLAMVSYHSVAKLYHRERADIADRMKWVEFARFLSKLF